MQTTNEILLDLTDKINTLVSVLSPSEIKENPELKPIISRLDAMQESIANISKNEGYDESVLNAAVASYDKTLKQLEELVKKMNSNTCIPKVEEEQAEDIAFAKKRWVFVLIGTSITCVLATVAFNYVVPAFVHTMGLFTTMLGFLVWLFVDKYLFKGDSIGKMGQTSIGVGLASIAIMGLYGIGVSIGNSYLSNPNGGSNETAPQVIERVIEQPKSDTTGQQQPSTSRGNDVVLPQRTGTAQGEQ